MWPSILDEDPGWTDLFTFHEALPVVKGVKLAAQVWIHQYDYYAPRIERRCALESFSPGSEDPRWEACLKLERQPKGRCNTG